MRIDKYLKVSRIIKRRSVSKMLCDNKKVYINDKAVNPSHNVKIGDEIKIVFGQKALVIKVLKIVDSTKKEDADSMFEILEEMNLKGESE